jgi:hypothetical protein
MALRPSLCPLPIAFPCPVGVDGVTEEGALEVLPRVTRAVRGAVVRLSEVDFGARKAEHKRRREEGTAAAKDGLRKGGGKGGGKKAKRPAAK